MMMKNEHDLLIMPQSINFAPASILEEVSQNIITICTTMKYSVPMDRAFGIEADFLDNPVNSARAKICSEIVRAVNRFEPRAKITRIDFTGTLDGKIYPHIFFRLIS